MKSTISLSCLPPSSGAISKSRQFCGKTSETNLYSTEEEALRLRWPRPSTCGREICLSRRDDPSTVRKSHRFPSMVPSACSFLPSLSSFFCRQAPRMRATPPPPPPPRPPPPHDSMPTVMLPPPRNPQCLSVRMHLLLGGAKPAQITAVRPSA